MLAALPVAPEKGFSFNFWLLHPHLGECVQQQPMREVAAAARRQQHLQALCLPALGSVVAGAARVRILQPAKRAFWGSCSPWKRAYLN